MSRDERELVNRGWTPAKDPDTREPIEGRWIEPTLGTKPYRNKAGQWEYPAEHRPYTTAEAVEIEKRRDETAEWLKEQEEERKKREAQGGIRR